MLYPNTNPISASLDMGQNPLGQPDDRVYGNLKLILKFLVGLIY